MKFVWKHIESPKTPNRPHEWNFPNYHAFSQCICLSMAKTKKYRICQCSYTIYHHRGLKTPLLSLTRYISTKYMLIRFFVVYPNNYLYQDGLPVVSLHLLVHPLTWYPNSHDTGTWLWKPDETILIKCILFQHPMSLQGKLLSSHIFPIYCLYGLKSSLSREIAFYMNFNFGRYNYFRMYCEIPMHAY